MSDIPTSPGEPYAMWKSGEQPRPSISEANELRKDAARYREWRRTGKSHMGSLPDEIDAAIDAAIAASDKP